MADWAESSAQYLQLHQIGQIWERITHALVTMRPDNVIDFMISKLETLKTQKDVPGRRLVFLIGGPGSGAEEVAVSLAQDLSTVPLDGSIFISQAGGAEATAEKVALTLRSTLLDKGYNVFTIHNYPVAISQALLTEIQVTPASLCIYLEIPEEDQAVSTGRAKDDIQAEMNRDVLPLVEYYKAKESLLTIDKTQPDWYDKVKTAVEREKSSSRAFACNHHSDAMPATNSTGASITIQKCYRGHLGRRETRRKKCFKKAMTLLRSVVDSSNLELYFFLWMDSALARRRRERLSVSTGGRKRKRKSLCDSPKNKDTRDLNRVARELGELHPPSCSDLTDDSSDELQNVDVCIDSLLSSTDEEEEFIWLQDILEHVNTGSTEQVRHHITHNEFVLPFLQTKFTTTDHTVVKEIIIVTLNKVVSKSIQRTHKTAIIKSDILMQALKARNHKIVLPALGCIRTLCFDDAEAKADLVDLGVLEKLFALLSSSAVADLSQFFDAVVTTVAYFLNEYSCRSLASRKQLLSPIISAAYDAVQQQPTTCDALAVIFYEICQHKALLKSISFDLTALLHLALAYPSPERTVKLLTSLQICYSGTGMDNSMKEVRASPELRDVLRMALTEGSVTGWFFLEKIMLEECTLSANSTNLQAFGVATVSLIVDAALALLSTEGAQTAELHALLVLRTLCKRRDVVESTAIKTTCTASMLMGLMTRYPLESMRHHALAICSIVGLLSQDPRVIVELRNLGIEADPARNHAITPEELLWVQGTEDSIRDASLKLKAAIRIQAVFRGGVGRRRADDRSHGTQYILHRAVHMLSEFGAFVNDITFDEFTEHRCLQEDFEQEWQRIIDNARKIEYERLEIKREVEIRHHNNRQTLLCVNEEKRSELVKQEKRMLDRLKALHETELEEVDANIADAKLLSQDEQNVILITLLERRERTLKHHARLRIDVRNAEAQQRDKLSAICATQLENLAAEQAENAPHLLVAVEEERSRGLGQEDREVWWSYERSIVRQEVVARLLLETRVSVYVHPKLEFHSRESLAREESSEMEAHFSQFVDSITRNKMVALIEAESYEREGIADEWLREVQSKTLPTLEYLKRWLEACKRISNWMDKQVIEREEAVRRMVLYEWEDRDATEMLVMCSAIALHMSMYSTAGNTVLPNEEASCRRSLMARHCDEHDILLLSFDEVTTRVRIMNCEEQAVVQSVRVYNGTSGVFDEEAQSHATLCCEEDEAFEKVMDLFRYGWNHFFIPALGVHLYPSLCCVRSVLPTAAGNSLEALCSFSGQVLDITVTAASVAVVSAVSAVHEPFRLKVRRTYSAATNALREMTAEALCMARMLPVVFLPQVTHVTAGKVCLSEVVSDVGVRCSVVCVRCGNVTFHVISGSAPAAAGIIRFLQSNDPSSRVIGTQALGSSTIGLGYHSIEHSLLAKAFTTLGLNALRASCLQNARVPESQIVAVIKVHEPNVERLCGFIGRTVDLVAQRMPLYTTVGRYVHLGFEASQAACHVSELLTVLRSVGPYSIVILPKEETYRDYLQQLGEEPVIAVHHTIATLFPELELREDGLWFSAATCGSAVDAPVSISYGNTLPSSSTFVRNIYYGPVVQWEDTGVHGVVFKVDSSLAVQMVEGRRDMLLHHSEECNLLSSVPVEGLSFTNVEVVEESVPSSLLAALASAAADFLPDSFLHEESMQHTEACVACVVGDATFIECLPHESVRRLGSTLFVLLSCDSVQEWVRGCLVTKGSKVGIASGEVLHGIHGKDAKMYSFIGHAVDKALALASGSSQLAVDSDVYDLVRYEVSSMPIDGGYVIASARKESEPLLPKKQQLTLSLAPQVADRFVDQHVGMDVMDQSRSPATSSTHRSSIGRQAQSLSDEASSELGQELLQESEEEDGGDERDASINEEVLEKRISNVIAKKQEVHDTHQTDDEVLEFLLHPGITMLMSVPKAGIARMRGLTILKALSWLDYKDSGPVLADPAAAFSVESSPVVQSRTHHKERKTQINKKSKVVQPKVRIPAAEISRRHQKPEVYHKNHDSTHSDTLILFCCLT